jgi:hypothetical protein
MFEGIGEKESDVQDGYLPANVLVLSSSSA